MLNYKNLVFVDLSVTKNSPAGSCVRSEILAILNTLNVKIDLYTTECDLEHINLKIHKIKVINNVLFLKYILFYIQCLYKVKSRQSIIQCTQGQYPFAQISYPHFCHRAYLKNQWKTIKLPIKKRLPRLLNHSFQAWCESICFKRANIIVVPSAGLKKDIEQHYPAISNKIVVINNPVDIELYRRPIEFNVVIQKESIGLKCNDFVVVFSALGDFSRKGLDILFSAMQSINNPLLKLLVVGGKGDELNLYKKKVIELHLEDKVLFTGFQKDIRPYLWVGDIFSLPSTYEIFPLVVLQAAAAGLPIMVTKLYGVEEYLQDSINGWVVSRDSSSISETLEMIILNKDELESFRQNIHLSVLKYSFENFSLKWLQLYRGII